MLKTILIDDEPRGRENLRILLNQYCKDEIEIIGECDNIENAFADITVLKPQLIFLDIEMGKGTGFDLLTKFETYPFKVVFVTAFDQYAIKAIKFSALDYLLKPVLIGDLVQAVAKAKRIFETDNKANFQSLFEFIRNPHKKSNQIAIPMQNGYRMVAVDKIMYCRAQKEYTFIHLGNGEAICSSLNLGEYEELLTDYDFFRIHHSYIMNRQYIQKYIRGDGGEIITSDNQNIPVSRRRKDEFLDWLTAR